MLFIESIEQQLLNALDHDLDNASDDWLFTSGYLRAHISLAVAHLLACSAPSSELTRYQQMEQLKLTIDAGIEQAIAVGELTPRDQQLVKQDWQCLYQQTLQHFSLGQLTDPKSIGI